MPVSDTMFETLRDRVTSVEMENAVREEADRNIERRLDKIETILSRLTWLMVTGIGSAFFLFVASGGLRVPGS
jgi:pyruvate/2-oxoacid:ferredoxin oxidoreductase alpha subunit